MKRLTDVIGQCGYIGSPNRENMYSLGSLSDLYLLEAYKKFPNCEDKKWLSEYAKGKAVNVAIQKLGKHEDLEDELGIDLVKMSKAFAIIKEKKVDIWTLLLVDTVYKYNNFDYHFRTELTQEEFDLLKEVLM